MLDELPVHEASTPRRHRRKRGGRTALTLIMAAVLLGTLAVVGLAGMDKIKSFFTADDYEGDGNGVAVQIEIPEGATAFDIANVLVKADVVKSTEAFVDAANANPDANGILPGTYSLEAQMSGEAALALILSPDSKTMPEMTIPDGLEYWQTYKTLSASTGIDAKEFEKAGENPAELGVPEEWFTRNDGKEIEKSIEGFLFPDTYQFKENATAGEILSTMVTRFLDYADEVDFVDNVKALNFDMSPYEVLILASIAQAEAGFSHDLGKISRVFYNRLYGVFECEGCIQSDVTTNYGLMLAGDEAKASKHLGNDLLYDASNPYSTHAHKGLPPGPVDSPGKDALDSALHPIEGNWTYFVATDKDGTTEFTDDFEVHKQNIEKAEANGVL